MEWVPKMRDGPAELKRLVKRWVKDQAEMEEEEEEEQENEDEVMSAVAEGQPGAVSSGLLRRSQCGPCDTNPYPLLSPQPCWPS